MCPPRVASYNPTRRSEWGEDKLSIQASHHQFVTLADCEVSAGHASYRHLDRFRCHLTLAHKEFVPAPETRSSEGRGLEYSLPWSCKPSIGASSGIAAVRTPPPFGWHWF